MSGFRRKKGFERAARLADKQIRSAGESRGFAVSRLLTHWDDIVGPDLCSVAEPVDVSYGRGFGATLTLLTKGAMAPMVEMQKERIRERVNACYGYAAIQKIRLTQTSAHGFAEDQAAFTARPKLKIRAEDREAATAMAAPVASDTLRSALETLGANVLSKRKQEYR
ncbi:MAG: DciA family protein [Pseudomonadota bacterium]